MIGSPYISSDDSRLIRRALAGRRGGACLELGAGNGGNMILASKGYGTVVGTDLSKPAMMDWKEHGGYVLADGGSCFRSGVFDLVFFNPPYVPEEETGDQTVDGGRGLEVPKELLKEALRVVRERGTVLFLLNDEAEIGEFQEICRQRGFGVRRVLSERLFYEVISVYEATLDRGVAGQAVRDAESA
jgi:release factor glutamine methyltransferase